MFFEDQFEPNFSLIVVGVVALLIILSSIQVVRTQTVHIVERLGKYRRTLSPGLHFIIPVFDKVVSKPSLRIHQLDVTVETKTKDNVFVTIPVMVQYRVIDPVKSYYTLEDYQSQLQSYVYDRVRTSVAKLELDRAFESKDEIAMEVEETLKGVMSSYGFEIINTLVTDINPDVRVKESMNSINAAYREREATLALAEADKIKLVKKAEAEAESKKLQGQGIADQRSAIIEGLVSQYKALEDVGVGSQAQEILLITQYFDTLAEVAKASQTKTLMLPSNPGGVSDIINDIRSLSAVKTQP